MAIFIIVICNKKQQHQHHLNGDASTTTSIRRTRMMSNPGAFLFVNAFQATTTNNSRRRNHSTKTTNSRRALHRITMTTTRSRHLHQHPHHDDVLFAMSSRDLRQDSSRENVENETQESHDKDPPTTTTSPASATSTTTSSTTIATSTHNPSLLIHSIQNSFKNVNLPLTRSKRVLQVRKRNWIEKSTAYYSTVMRNESRRARGQIKPSQNTLDYHKRNLAMAKKLYFARNKIKTGALNHAETIYRKLIDELIQEEEDEEECDHAQLAISTLLLALLLQRKNQVTETRKVFNRFFTIIHSRNNQVEDDQDTECACSAKVLQAYALFEMKQGHVRKAYRLAQMAVKLDSELYPLLQWKQFRDAKELSIVKNGSWNSI
jgi:hypothetical protein